MPFQPKSPRPPLSPPELLDFAVRSLSSKMKSIRDLRRKLAERAEPGDTGAAAIDAVLSKLKDLGYLSDERFAADYTRLRKENQKFGKRRVQQGLFQKGIAQDLANSTIAKAYDEIDEADLAKQYIARKRMKKPEDDKQTARAMRRLLAAGFSTRTIWKVLRAWGTELEEVDIVDDEA